MARNSEEKSPLQIMHGNTQTKLNICLFVSQVPWVDKGRGLDSWATFYLQMRVAKPAHLCKCKVNDLDFLSGMQALLCPAWPKEFRLLVFCSKWFTDAEGQIQRGCRCLKVNSCNQSFDICSLGLCARYLSPSAVGEELDSKAAGKLSCSKCPELASWEIWRMAINL